MQAQWAEAVIHENEKLHQLSDLQKAIITQLQKGASEAAAAGPAVADAGELSERASSARKASQDACQLRASLLAHTGHAKV